MVKIISLSDAAYSTLKKVKGRRSFSETVLDLFKPKKETLFDVFGKWPGPKEELDKIEKLIAEDRKKFKLKEVSF
jgi:predicted CopG family antitoxin